MRVGHHKVVKLMTGGAAGGGAGLGHGGAAAPLPPTWIRPWLTKGPAGHTKSIIYHNR